MTTVAPKELQPDADAVADFVLRLVALKSTSGNEEAVAAELQSEMRKLGYSVDVDDWGNVIGKIEGDRPGPTVLIDGHIDTVEVSDPSKWTRNPWGEVADGKVYGRGSVDMKGALGAAVQGVGLLAGRLDRGTVVVSGTVTEELVEGPALVAVADRVSPDFVVVGEATSNQLARGGRGRAEVKVDVFGRPTHTSRPDLGINAAEAMADVITAFRGFRPPTHPVLGEGILVLTDVTSRPYPGLSVVPEHSLATYDRRTLPGETEADILGPLLELASKALEGSEATVRVSIAEDDFTTYAGKHVVAPNFAPSWFFDEDTSIVAASLAALQEAGVPTRISHYSFCTNGSGTAGLRGIPTVGFGPGAEELAHRIDEHIEIDELALGALGYAAIAARLTRLEE